MPLNSLPDDSGDSASSSDEDEEISADEDEHEPPPDPYARFQGPNLDAQEGENGKMSEVEAVLFMLDLMSSHKTTDELGKSVWDVLRAALGEDMVTFNSVKALLKMFQTDHVVVVDICVRDCIAFYDCPAVEGCPDYKHGHRSACPKCGEERWVVEPKTGKRKARKV